MDKEKISIIGAGLVGSLLSIYLSRKNKYDINIYEGRNDMRKQVVGAGRSINLALSDRGIKALEEVGIMNEIREICIPMHGRQIHLKDGSINYQPYGEEGQYINSVSRGELNKKLMDLAEQENVKIHFNKKCAHIDWSKNHMTFKDSKKIHEIVEGGLIFGSDGAFSAARLNYQLQHDRFEYHQTYIDYGYKELTIPPDADGSFQMEKNALHIWPRGNYMLIALPNMDGSFTCTLFFPFDGEVSFSSLNTGEKFQDFFAEEFKDAAGLMPNLQQEYLENPTASLVTIKCYPWVSEDKFALIGDAAHALVPFFGQGMNCGFEDCSVLNDVWEKHEGNWSEILPKYQALRKPDADAISDLALANFIEMRDKVADEKFIAQKKIEAAFANAYPDKWIPAYSMVTFRPDIRYSEALSKGKIQQQIMDRVMGEVKGESWEWNKTTETSMLAELQ